MRIDSNIAGVIRQTERLMANIPVAMQRALQPDRWQVEAEQMANTILLTIAEPQERRFIPQFISTLKMAVIGDGSGSAAGLRLTMWTPFPELRDMLTEAQAMKASRSNADLGMGLFDLPFQEFEDLILKWVETPETEGGKEWGAIDAGKSPGQVAALITWIMLTPRELHSKKGKDAQDALLPHITKFLARSQADRLTPAKVDLWLRTVLEAWREMVRIKYPAKVREELKALSEQLL